VRLLKLDVEGAEEIVLRGLGRFLADHVIDFILAECYDERLRLLNSSAERVGALLQSAGYVCWEYGKETPSGWSKAAQVRSRGDCNYLFVSPAVREPIPGVSLGPALAQALGQRDQLQAQKDQLLAETATLKQNVEKLQDDVDWLLEDIKRREGEQARLAAGKRELELAWVAVQNSAGWRMLNLWRKMRGRLAPDGSLRGRLYHSLIRPLGGGR
jgi:hypothetical protein